MRCEEIGGLLDLYLDDALTEEAATRIARHILRCPQCAVEIKTLQTTRELLREGIAPESASPEFYDRTLARLQAAFLAKTRTPSLGNTSRQWTLPFAREDREAG